MLVFDQLKRGDPRLRWLAIGVLAGMFVLATGLWLLQVVNYKKYEKSLISQSYRSVRMPAVRGRIMDRNGVILAESRPSYNINVYLEELRPYFTDQYYVLKSNAVVQIKQENLNLPKEKQKKYTNNLRLELEAQARYIVIRSLMGRVSQIVKAPLELSEKDFRNYYDKNRSFPLPIAVNLTPAQVALFAESGSQLPGVDLQVQSLRSYPQGPTAAHILGYMTRTEKAEGEDDIDFDYRLPDFKGVVGVEGAFDEELRGVSGAKNLLVNNMQYRQSENVWQPPKPGDDLVLTVDVEVQKAAELALKQNGLGIRGAVVAMDVTNGDILAMASAPSFDPNDFVPSISHDIYAKYNDKENKPMLNRASFGIYQPGSSFKIVVALAALEAGKVNLHEEIFSPGFFQIGREKMKCTAGAGHFDFHRAFIKSCNCYFAEYGIRTGLDNVLRMGNEFCLGEKTGLPTRQDLGGYFPPVGTRKKNMGGRWTDGDTAHLSIGQGDIAVTPMQMTVLAAAVANGGTVFWPRLVERLENDDNGNRTIIQSYETARVRNVVKINPANLRTLHEAMRDDVADPEGTGVKAAVKGWQVCGKTGTAVVEHTGSGPEARRITWFVSFAPFDSPRYAVVAMVENGSSGGGACAPIAKRVYESLQKMEQTPRAGEKSLVMRN